MPNDPLIEIIAKRIEAGYIIMSNPENARRDAQAALAALKAEGWMLVKWEPYEYTNANDPPDAHKIMARAYMHGFKLTGLEPPKVE